MTAQVIDFDKWREEARAKAGTVEQESPKIRLGGKEYELVPTLPAAVALDVIRLKKAEGSDASLDGELVFLMGDSLFKDDFRDILAENRLSMEEGAQLIKMAFGAYQLTESPVPNRKTRRARKRST